MSTEHTITCTHVKPSTTVEHPGAVDATVTIDGRDYGVTLLPSEWDGELDRWGSLDHWIADGGPAWLSGDRDAQERIVAAVRAATQAPDRRSAWNPHVEAEHLALVHSDGSECPDGCGGL